MINFGDSSIKTILFGELQVEKVILGEIEVWANKTPGLYVKVDSTHAFDPELPFILISRSPNDNKLYAFKLKDDGSDFETVEMFDTISGYPSTIFVDDDIDPTFKFHFDSNFLKTADNTSVIGNIRSYGAGNEWKPSISISGDYSDQFSVTNDELQLDSEDVTVKGLKFGETIDWINEDSTYNTAVIYQQYPTVYRMTYRATSQIVPNIPSYIYGTFSDGKGTLYFSERLTTIPNDAFANQTALTSVKFPSSVTSIGTGVFSGCSNLTSANIPGNEIPDDTFNGCSSITEFDFTNYHTIGNSAFAGTGLTEVLLKNNDIVLGDDVFDNTPLTTILIYNPTPSGSLGQLDSIEMIKVPSASVDAYKEAWSEYESLIVSLVNLLKSIIIDQDHNASFNLGIKTQDVDYFDFYGVMTHGDGGCWLGTFGQNDDTDWRLFDIGDTFYYDCARNRQNPSLSENQIMNIRCGNYYLDNLLTGERMLEGDYSEPSSDYNFTINTTDQSNVPTNFGIIYGVKFYKNNELIANFVPAIDLDNVPYLYDTLNDTSIYSSTGTPDYELAFNGLTFKSVGSTSIQYIPSTVSTAEYSTDGIIWNSLGSVTLDLNDGDKIYVRGEINGNQDGSNYRHFKTSGSGTVQASGNINSLINKTEYRSIDTIPSYEMCFNRLFYNCKNLTTAPELPATTLYDRCYQSMFEGCEALITVPQLPATNLAPNCYYSMFYGCTSITSAANLPATTLAEYCYAYMYSGCSNLTTIPTLGTPTLAQNCYNGMFNGCTSLTVAPELPVTTLAARCYSNMFNGCSSLTEAPILPATTLVTGCYDGMFNSCSQLNKITTYATNWAVDYWVNNVSPTGDFYNLGGASIPIGLNGIPTNWTEHTTL